MCSEPRFSRRRSRAGSHASPSWAAVAGLAAIELGADADGQGRARWKSDLDRQPPPKKLDRSRRSDGAGQEVNRRAPDELRDLDVRGLTVELARRTELEDVA